MPTSRSIYVQNRVRDMVPVLPVLLGNSEVLLIINKE